jgi:hypothetical protein
MLIDQAEQTGWLLLIASLWSAAAVAAGHFSLLLLMVLHIEM